MAANRHTRHSSREAIRTHHPVFTVFSTNRSAGTAIANLGGVPSFGGIYFPPEALGPDPGSGGNAGMQGARPGAAPGALKGKRLIINRG